MKNTLTALAIVLIAGTSSVMALSPDDANAAVKKWSGYDVDTLQKEASALSGQDSYPFCIVKQDGKLMRTVFPDKSKLGEDVTANSVVTMMASSLTPTTTGSVKVTYTWSGKDKGAYLRTIKDMGGSADGFCGYSFPVSAPTPVNSANSAVPAANPIPAANSAMPVANAAPVVNSGPASMPVGTTSPAPAAK